MITIGATSVGVRAVRNDLKLWTILNIGSNIILCWSLNNLRIPYLYCSVWFVRCYWQRFSSLYVGVRFFFLLQNAKPCFHGRAKSMANLGWQTHLLEIVLLRARVDSDGIFHPLFSLIKINFKGFNKTICFAFKKLVWSGMLMDFPKPPEFRPSTEIDYRQPLQVIAM